MEKELIKVVIPEDVDDTIESMLKSFPEKIGWKAKEPRVESVAGGKVKIIIRFIREEN